MSGTHILIISSRTILKSSPCGSPEEKAPGTFSQHKILGRTDTPDRPRSISAFLISFVIRICSMKSPERAPAKPALAPATERSWHGLPPAIISTGGSSAPFSLVISPQWSIWGKCVDVTAMGNGSISLAHNGTMPLFTAARGKPPMPSNKLPSVSITCSPPELWPCRYVPPSAPCRLRSLCLLSCSCRDRRLRRCALFRSTRA